MRLFISSPTFRTFLAVPFLTAMLAFPASAETNPNAVDASGRGHAIDRRGQAIDRRDQ